jgi:AcrR family transcriptional regulator
MQNDLAPENGWRGSREGWLQAAYEALIEGGLDAVKIKPLAERLRLSRTSFYWFFKDRSELLGALRERWERATTDPLVAATRAYAETETEAMLNVTACFLSDAAFDQRLEFAARSWALQDREMMPALHRADTERLAALVGMLGTWGHDPHDADVRARTIYLVQIGYIAMQVSETLEERIARVPKYVEIYTGKPPTQNEIARFRANLGAAD